MDPDKTTESTLRELSIVMNKPERQDLPAFAPAVCFYIVMPARPKRCFT